MDVLLRVHDLYLLPQLRDDGARPPAMLQSQILQRGKKKTTTSFQSKCYIALQPNRNLLPAYLYS